ncbi:enoyl-CoA hydratase/isomerase family protein [Sphingobium phenoxybenzoativorans]|uniref:3-hydroxyisobutyryl-CoA hydrolase n=1 Tax=Sphingobium phenoxybenzoativorans TaxID=1592790 RepID=A0A975Q2I1_9SPHN|nr:enoyl-CoA hydratase/isomerase family protein [Sphingobium phenoxybenzoativorans]QUT06879.1 enoyl-CoA hydratase/isomerase family protein [Sphingobium phenoxybenzoativorans]
MGAATTPDIGSGEVLIYDEGNGGRLRFNRPSVIHALNARMCGSMIVALLEWANRSDINVVLLDHAEGRGFCAGGDLVTLIDSVMRQDGQAEIYLRSKYQLDHLLFTYAKPIVAFMDGIVMGGGVGIAQPCRYRVATERTLYAMPETKIGSFPDAGSGRYLSRLPGRIGQYVGLTGARLSGEDCVALGIATHFVPFDRVDDLKAALLTTTAGSAEVLARFEALPPPSPVLTLQPMIDRLFASDRYEDLLIALAEDRGEWAASQYALLEKLSPQGCRITLQLLARGAGIKDFAEEMAMEFAVASRVVRSAEFIEGVRALIIEKRSPRWGESGSGHETDLYIDSFFAPLSPEKTWRPLIIGGADGV